MSLTINVRQALLAIREKSVALKQAQLDWDMGAEERKERINEMLERVRETNSDKTVFSSRQ